MKSSAPQRVSLFFVCAVALALGVAMRARQGGGGASSPPQPPASAPDKGNEALNLVTIAGNSGSPANEKLLLRRAIAKCDEASLWEWVAVPTDSGDVLEVVVAELVDRLGWGAWQHVLEMEAGESRSYLARYFLIEFAKRDPWKAYEEWKKSRGSFTDEERAWADGASYSFVTAAAATSAGKLIEVLQELRPDTDHYEHGTDLSFAPDFDFEKVLDFLASRPERPFVIPENLLVEWSKHSPREAAVWWSANRYQAIPSYEPWKIYANIAGSKLDDEAMRGSLGMLDPISPGLADMAWNTIASKSKGAVNPDLLRTATLLDRREDYVVDVLLQTRFQEALDASWQQLPLDERLRAKAAAEERWTGESPRPVDDRARERWRKMLAQAWSQ